MSYKASQKCSQGAAGDGGFYFHEGLIRYMLCEAHVTGQTCNIECFKGLISEAELTTFVRKYCSQVYSKTITE